MAFLFSFSMKPFLVYMSFMLIGFKLSVFSLIYITCSSVIYHDLKSTLFLHVLLLMFCLFFPLFMTTSNSMDMFFFSIFLFLCHKAQFQMAFTDSLESLLILCNSWCLQVGNRRSPITWLFLITSLIYSCWQKKVLNLLICFPQLYRV